MKTLDLRYIEFLTDNFGIWQHSKGTEIDREHGYALDDSARALLVALQYSRLDLAEIYLNFLDVSCCSRAQSINFFDAQKQPVDHPVSPDALGESYWAVAKCIDQGFQVEKAQKIANRLKKELEHTAHLRTQSYTLLGAVLIDSSFAKKLASSLAKSFQANEDPTWIWPEQTLTYANAIIPLALLAESSYQKEALAMLTFLNEVSKHNGIPIAIGNQGWYPKGGRKALYDQQPIDPAYHVLANAQAYLLTGEASYKQEAKLYLDWFWGNNLAGLPLIDGERHRCLDGLTQEAISVNAGSECTVCYILAQAAYAQCE